MSEIDDIMKKVLGDHAPLKVTGPPKPLKGPTFEETVVDEYAPIPEAVIEELTAEAPETLEAPEPPPGEEPLPIAVSAVPTAVLSPTASLEDEFEDDDEEPVPSSKTPKAGVIKTPREKKEKPALVPVPIFTAVEIGESFDLRALAMLASMSTSRWNAKTKDRTVAKEAEQAQDARVGAFEAYKRLLIGNDAPLKKVTAALDGARSKHYAMTLPWTTVGVGDESKRTGARLLPNTLWFDYVKAMAMYKGQMDKALDAFVPLYPGMIEKAKESLGKRFDITEFPSPAEIRAKFDLSFHFDPVPKGADFEGSQLKQDQIDRLALALQDKTETMLKNAMEDVWARLHGIMVRMEDRLKDPENIFHTSMIDGVRDLASLMGHLNVTKDQRITDLKDYIDSKIVPYDADELREKALIRAKVHAAVVHVLAEMDTKGANP